MYSNDFGDETAQESNLIRLQTLHYADKQKIDVHILELLTLLHQLMSFGRYRHDATKLMPTRSQPKGLDFQSKMRQLLSTTDSSGKAVRIQLSEEDRSLLEEVMARKRSPGVSRSEDLALARKTEGLGRSWRFSKSVGSSPAKDFGTRLRLDHQNSNFLDIMDGLQY